MTDTPPPPDEGYDLVVFGPNPPEIALLRTRRVVAVRESAAGQPDAVTVVSDRVVCRPPLKPVASAQKSPSLKGKERLGQLDVVG